MNEFVMLRKLFKTIYYIVITAIIFFALILTISIFPITGNIKILTVLSGSMEPKIHTGSIVIIKPQDIYNVGDVITYGLISKTDIPTTHRIVEEKVVNGQMVFKTKGDANNSADNKDVKNSEISGKVYFSIPYLGYVINFLKKPIGIMLIIFVPGVMIIYDEMKKIGKEISKLVTQKKPEEEKADENPKL